MTPPEEDSSGHQQGAVKADPPAGQEASPAPAQKTKLAEEFVAKGDRCRDRRDWAGARAAYEQALKHNPGLQHIWIQLGHACKEGGDHEAAEAAYGEAVHLRPDDPEAHLQIGHLFKVRKLKGPALEAFRRALDLDPGLTHVRAEILALTESMGVQQVKSITPAAGRYPRMARAPEAGALPIVFDVSDLMHYFRNARLPTGIQRVQMEVIRTAIEAMAPGVYYSIVCFTKETDFWIEIPPLLFDMLCKHAVIDGDHQAPEWTTLLADLDSVLSSKNYFAFARGSVLLNLGTSWWLQNYFLNVRLAKSLYDIKYVPFVHDFIPVMAPEHCVSDLRQDFITWAIGAFDHADYFLVNSKATLADLQTVGRKLGYGPRSAAVVTLDADFRRTLPDDALDEIGDPVDYLRSLGLEKGNYVLFVSTIESRKNHLSAFSVWLKLIKKRGIKGVPKLVCVGNPGWLNDAAYSKLNASELLTDHVLMLSKISDAALSVLYENCTCTLYPSSYEGWGLPVTEALCYGKVPVISNVSSLPEAGGAFAEYFDVESEKDMMEAIERVVYDEKYRARRELKIVAEFRPRPWSAISEQIVEQLRGWALKGSSEAHSDKAMAAYGVWPIDAELGLLHSLTSNKYTALWAGLKSGEIYRNGPGWWWPEPWGSWIKNQGPAQVAFVVSGVANAPIQVYLGLRGVQGKPSVVNIKCEGARAMNVPLGPDQDKVISFVVDPAPDDKRLLVMTITCNAVADFRAATNGADFRVCGNGVRWFYACREDDVPARLRMIEAISLNDYPKLQRQPPDMDFFLHT
ncbi:MAG TPA: glycosyltransferase [Rhizomicrobium sp.]|nr:glycosyltransferase [Rhizomicrobium sp.]